ncbi:MAG: transposase [archaeon]|nr:MAG: transposase [archaeon]
MENKTITKQDLGTLYWKHYYSINKIADKFSCSPTKVHYWLKKYGIKRRKENKKHLKLTKELLVDMYLDQKMSLNEIARKFNCNDTNILYWLKKFGVERRPPDYRKIHIPKDILEELYWKKNQTTAQIASKFGIKHGSTVRKKLVKERIKTKSLSQALTKKRRSPFSGNLNEKSFLLGLRAGDFHGRMMKKSLRFQTTTTHLAQIDLLCRSLEKYGEICTYLSKNEKRDDEWFIYTDLHESFGFLLSKPEEIPEWIMTENSYFYNFFAAYMDCEGSWQVQKSHENSVRFIFRITSGDKAILTQLKSGLEDRGAYPLLYSKGTSGYTPPYGTCKKEMYELILYRKNDIFSLITELLPLSKHSEKIRKMNFIAKNKQKRWKDVEKEWNRIREDIKMELLKNQTSKGTVAQKPRQLLSSA